MKNSQLSKQNILSSGPFWYEHQRYIDSNSDVELLIILFREKQNKVTLIFVQFTHLSVQPKKKKYVAYTENRVS